MASEHIVISIVSNYVLSFTKKKMLPAADYTSLTGPTFLQDSRRPQLFQNTLNEPVFSRPHMVYLFLFLFVFERFLALQCCLHT